MTKAHLYDGKTVGYYENVREDVTELISLGPNKILEVGCAKGYTLKKLKETGKASEIVGIEMDKNSVEYAKNCLDCVIDGDIEEMNSLPFNKNHFDYIVFADVLEHLINPWRVLRMLADYLSEKGSIIAVIPNLRHKSVIRPLVLQGKFQYTCEGGPLDISHLRFFTRELTRSLFESAGYSKIYFADYSLSFKAKLATLLSLGFLKDFFVYKFRVVARK